ncbi:MAG: acyl-CoA dehydrogenase, partial [Betaproteobacteria bacterium]|nr:acyl-CoA dehydrogenase [Betaproteobacteria bacterium]
MNAPLEKGKAKAEFAWNDPFLLDAQFTEEERMVRDAAHAYCQDKLGPRVLNAFRKEETDKGI